MNFKLRFLLWFVNNIKPIRQVEYKDVPKQRKVNEKVSGLGKILFDKKTDVKETEDTSFHGIPVRIYRYSVSPKQPVIIYFHGGGFVYYSVESHDYVARRHCDMNQCTVISVDYRLAPEHPFPAAHQDAYTVIGYVHEHAAELGIDSSQMIVAGDSAGANIAACACHHFRNYPDINIAAQVLVYPWVDGKMDTPSIEKYQTGYLLTRDALLWFQQAYTPDPADHCNPEVSPIYQKDFGKLPPCFVLTAEYDPLKDEGFSYSQKLKEAGNAVWYKDYKALVHGFMNMPFLSSEAMRAYQDIQAFINLEVKSK
ncbi:MAG: alpha/beta hydrolase [Sphingobacteriales bacterium]|nr:alpha/beta hydrolase [Sphingobacteriales bacterium]